jgi:c-di-GMP-binding flagellar brake protein YcgR
MFEFKYADEEKMKREAVRVEHPSLKVTLGQTKIFFPVIDLSVTGVAFKPGRYAKKFSGAAGKIAYLSIWFGKDLIVSNIKAKVVRAVDEMIAFQLQEVSQEHERKLDKLVLEIQKMMIEQKKKRKI